MVWSRKVSELTMKYPESEKELQFGESYFWNVEGEYLVDTEKSANHMFTVLSLENSKEVADHESAIRNSFRENPESSTLHSLLAAYYIDQGLLQDAISEFRIISGINADAPLPHEILGSLYSEIGEKDKAIAELQKALTLANNKDN
jgi:tetratricopeptide (TPR) repeat protein